MFFTPSTRNAVQSSMVSNLEVSAADNQAIVTYKDGRKYLYTNISEEAIFDLLFGTIDSFGKWVNNACKCEDVSFFSLAWSLSLIKQHLHTLMTATTLSPLEVHVADIIESDSVSAVDKFLTELSDYGIDTVDQFDDAYSGCYPDVATFCEDLLSDIYHQEIESLPSWLQCAIDWDLVWHQSLRHNYFEVYFNGEYYLFNRDF